MILLDLFFITIITVLIVDISGFIDTLKRCISFIITKGKIVKDDWDLPLFSCSFCMTWWLCLTYLIVSSKVSLMYICLALLLSFITSTIKNLLFTFRNIIDFLINKINNLL